MLIRNAQVIGSSPITSSKNLSVFRKGFFIALRYGKELLHGR